jgi:hypothetical protein
MGLMNFVALSASFEFHVFRLLFFAFDGEICVLWKWVSELIIMGGRKNLDRGELFKGTTPEVLRSFAINLLPVAFFSGYSLGPISVKIFLT